MSDVSIKGSGVKAEVFHTNWEGQSEFVRDDIMDTTYYSVEFDKTDSSPEVVEFYDGVFENVLPSVRMVFMQSVSSPNLILLVK